MLALLFLVLAIAMPILKTPVSAVEAPEQVYVYNTSSPAVYILTPGGEKDSTYRVYSDSACQNLLGEAQKDALGGYCVVPLKESPGNNSTIYVTRETQEGVSKAKSISTGASATPSIGLWMLNVNEKYKVPANSYSESPNFEGQRIFSNGKLVEGNFYQVEVRLSNFAAIDSVTIPLRYDTSCLEPASIKASGSASYLRAMTESVKNAALSGSKAFAVPSANSLNYGIVPGYHFNSWKSADSSALPSFTSPPTDGTGSYQTVNTSTGLIKVEAGIETPAPFGQSGNTQFIRFFFRATKSVSLKSLPVWFATEADCPPDAMESDTLRITYYDPASPNGIFPALGGANVMTAPPVLQSASLFDEAEPVQLNAKSIPDLPQSYLTAVAAGTLQQDEVQVYNYTNYTADGTGIGTLDATLDDRLVISSSTAIRPQEVLRVYVVDGTGYRKIGEGQANAEGQVDMSLGKNGLQPEGGTVYVAVVRNNQESAKVAVPYAKEVTRDVTFRICRSGWDGSHAGGNYAANPALLQDVEVGERLQMRIYFNNFYDLMSYGFAIHFNSAVVQAADANYEPMATGAVPEDAYKAGTTGFSVGEDLYNVTLTEQLVYYAWQRAENAEAAGDAEELASAEAEITELIGQLGLADREAFDQMANDVSVKYDMGVPDTTAPWKGGLLFAGNASETTDAFPYVDNDGGCVQFLSASLVRSPLTLERENGYHFLNINFVVRSKGNPDFRLAADSDSAYCKVLPQGKQAVLADGGYGTDGYGIGITEHWEVQPMGDEVKIELQPGNALLADGDNYAEFLYNGADYRDPGFTLRMRDGTTGDVTAVNRYYMDGDRKVSLPQYTETEALDLFRIHSGWYSDSYTLVYEYVAPDSTQTVQVERHINVIFQKGDVNRDGEIDLFDEQALANHLNGTSMLDTSDALYTAKTVDVDGDGTISDGDRDALRNNSLGRTMIWQDYTMPIS